jgi:hypothetical protein
MLQLLSLFCAELGSSYYTSRSEFRRPGWSSTITGQLLVSSYIIVRELLVELGRRREEGICDLSRRFLSGRHV